jgi:hypothetical protein
MAFKPFNFFRKHAKILMAATVLLAMFSFIIGDAISMRGGGGSALSRRLKGWFGIVDNPIAEVGGQGYDFNLLYDVFNQRRITQEFVQAVQQTGRENVLKDAGFTREDRSSEERFQKKREEILKNRPDALKPLMMDPSSLALEAVLSPLVELQQRLDRYIQVQQFARRGLDTSFFGPVDLPEETDYPGHPQNLVEFLYWQKKADDLGIVISSEAVRRDLVRAGFGRVREEDLSAIADRVLKNKSSGASTDQVIEWVANEIRAMIARAVVQDPGRVPGILLSTQVTPYDLWQAYVQVRTQLTVGMLPIKVDSQEFLSRVELPPQGDTEKWKEFTENKLKPLFEKYKNQEPDPTRDTPGFKIPKKYQIEFVYGSLSGVTDARTHYGQVVAAETALSLAGQAMAWAPLPVPGAEIYHAIRVYESHKLSGRYRLPEDARTLFATGTPLPDGSRYQLPLPPGPGPFGTGPGIERQTGSQQVLDVATALTQSSATPFGFTAVLRPTAFLVTRTLPQAHALEAVAAAASVGQNIGVRLLDPNLLAFAARTTEQHQPFHDVAAGIFNEILDDEVRLRLDRDLISLQKELENYGKTYRAELEKWRRQKSALEARGTKAPDFTPPPLTRKEGDKEVKEPVKDYVARWAKTRGLMYEGMKEPRGPYDLFNEKDATPMGTILRPVLQRSLPTFDLRPEEGIRNQLLGPRGLYEPATARAPNPIRDYTVKPMEYVLHWKVDETEARVPAFAEVEDKVLEAWKLQEARALAEEQANRFAKEAKTEDGERLLLDQPGYLPDKYLSRYEDLGRSLNFRKATHSYIELPPDDLLDKVLNALKEKGDTLVFANRPKSIYYLLVLKRRDEPKATLAKDIGEFDLNVIIPDQPRQMKVEGEAISTWVQHQRTREFLKAWLAYLRDRTHYDEAEANKAYDQFKSVRN